jgi:hypothetical protein
MAPMKLSGIAFETVAFEAVPESRHPGERGFAAWKTREVGNVRTRIVMYSPGYLADHTALPLFIAD